MAWTSRQRLDAPDVRMRIAFEHFSAKRAAKGNHSVAVLDPRKPISAGDSLFAHGALDEGRIHVTGIKLLHRRNGGRTGPPY